MIWQTKIAWTNTLVTAALLKDMQTEEFTIGDALMYSGTAISIAAIWQSEIRAVLVSAALATPAAPVAAAAISAYAIGGVISYAAAPEGEEAEALVEYAQDPIRTTYDIIEKEAIETYQQVEGIVTGAGHVLAKEVERRYEEKKMVAERLWDVIGVNRWSNPTPGYRLF